MSILSLLSEKYKRIAIVGMAKNSGKTTTLNYLVEQAMEEGIKIAVTSTGRDGENTDVVTGTEKPRVYLETGTVVSVPVQLYDMAEAGLEILKMTDYATPLGKVLLCRVVESGFVQIAGPVNTADHKKMCREILDLGVELVLIDGAIDRKSIAAPETSDAIILATGAVISRNLKRVAEETFHVVNLYSLPVLENQKIRQRILEVSERMGPGKERIRIFGENLDKELDLKTGLGSGKYLDRAIDENSRWVYLPGALTQSVIADIHPKKLKQVTLILKDPTKIFIGAASWQQLVKKGLTVRLFENIKVAAISTNPWAPGGYSFDHKEMLKAVKNVAGELPVIDVRSGELL